MALRRGYAHVEQTEFIMFENADDLKVAVENIIWMNDCSLQRPSFVSVCIIRYSVSGLGRN